jgi:hypothetical protein
MCTCTEGIIPTIFWGKLVISILINVVSPYRDVYPIQKWAISLNLLLVCINQPLKDLRDEGRWEFIRKKCLFVINTN